MTSPRANSMMMATTGISHRRLLIGNFRSRSMERLLLSPLIVMGLAEARARFLKRLSAGDGRVVERPQIACRPRLIKNELRRASEFTRERLAGTVLGWLIDIYLGWLVKHRPCGRCNASRSLAATGRAGAARG